MENFKTFKSNIVLNPSNINIIDCINYLQEHSEETLIISHFLFNLDFDDFTFTVNQKRDEIIEKIIESHPNYLEDFLRPIFNIPNSIIKNHFYQILRYKKTIRCCFLKDTKYNLTNLAELLHKTIKPPYNFFTKFFLKDDIELRPLFESLNSEVYKEIDNDMNHIQSIISNQLLKTCYIPTVSHCDSTNPRVSKFGGSAPYLRKEGPKTCQCGNDKLQTVFSFYVTSLPDEVKSMFPQNHEFVVVGYTCNACFIHQEVECYVDNEIDELVYDDVPSNDDIFNKPRTVISWDKKMMYPFLDAYFDDHLTDQLKCTDEELFFIRSILNDINEENSFQTYLLGYPFFTQRDDRPKNHKLLLEMEESEASTNMWGDAGTAQVWMTTGDDFGSFKMQFACY